MSEKPILPMQPPAPKAPKTIDPRKVAVVVLSRTPQLLELHLRSHALYTPEETPIVIVDTSDPDPDFEAKDEEPVEGAPTIAEEEEDEEEHEGEPFTVDDVYETAVQENLTYVDRRGRPGYYGNHCNAGAAEAVRVWEPELLVFANDDTVVGPDWLELMLSDLAELESRGAKKVGLLGARSNYVSGPQCVYDRTLMAFGVNGETVFPYPRIVTFFAAVRASVFEEVQGFDEKLPAHNHSDDILSARMLRAGLLNWVSRAFVYHAGSQTFARAGKDPADAAALYAEDMKRGEEYVHENYPDASGLFGETLQACFPVQLGEPEKG